MQIIRTIVWVLLLVALLLFTVFNWNPVEVKIWEGLVLETKIPALVIVSFLLGLVPMWLLHRANKFYLGRRISSLETAARSAAVTPVAADPVRETVVVEEPVSTVAPAAVVEEPVTTVTPARVVDEPVTPVTLPKDRPGDLIPEER